MHEEMKVVIRALVNRPLILLAVSSILHEFSFSLLETTLDKSTKLKIAVALVDARMSVCVNVDS